MNQPTTQRRLAAILAADVVGYSKLMAADEAATMNALRDHRHNLFDPETARHGGRIVKLMGDGTLVEFPSVVAAVECAVAIQTALAAGDSPIRLRIGINLGDIIIEGDDIYGDGVNVAARLEALAEPGGICISSVVHESLGNRVDARFADDGDHEVKNIARPIRVWRWSATGATAQAEPGAATTPAVPERPSIAVLPFQNMSSDAEQEYFSDGICEDIITELSRFREFLVIARNTTFTYKGKAVNVADVCRELAVRYVLEGSVRRAGSRIRVTGQLIDGASGNHVWADRYDRTIEEIFDVQDEITQAIVNAVAPHMMQAEISRAYQKRPQDLGAWDKVLQAKWHIGHFTADHVGRAIVLLEEAIAASPRLAQAHADLSVCHVMSGLYRWGGITSEEHFRKAMRIAREGYQLDASDAVSQSVLGLSSVFVGQYDDALAHTRQAAARNPNSATAIGFLSAVEAICGNYEASCQNFDRAMRLSPHDPLRGWWYSGKGIGAFIDGRYEDVLEITAECLRAMPDHPTSHRQRAAALAMLGRMDEAREALARLLELMPGNTIEIVRRTVPVKSPAARETWLEALRKAGLPA